MKPASEMTNEEITRELELRAEQSSRRDARENLVRRLETVRQSELTRLPGHCSACGKGLGFWGRLGQAMCGRCANLSD